MALTVVLDNVRTTLLLIPVLLVGVFLAQGLVRGIRSYRSGIPGPFLARFTRLWLVKEVWNGNFHATNVKLHKTYGPIVRIQPNEYSIDDPTVMKTIYGAGSHFKKSSWYSSSASPDFFHLNLFALQDSKTHAALRRQLSSYYSMSYLSKYEAFVNNNTKTICARLREFAQTGEVIDLAHWLQCYAFDVITEITYGRPFGFLERGDDVENLISIIEKLLFWGATAGYFPRIHYILAKYLGVDFGKPIPIFAIKRMIEREKAEKINTSASTIDFLTLLLDRHYQNSNEFTKETIVAACSQNVAAGSDTTGISLTATLYNFAKDPSSVEKVLKEIETNYPSKDRSDFLTFKEAQDLHYLQAAIKESLRLHPATGLILARLVPEGGVTLANHYFPEGTSVGVNTWVAHRNEEVYGKDAGIFRPERWLEADKDKLLSMERYFIPFGAGSRTCIGKNISLLEISKIVPVLLRNFEFQLQGDWEKDFATNQCDWFVKPRALPVIVKERP